MSLSVGKSTLPSPISRFHLDDWPKDAPQVWVKREDLIHPVVSGNKWRKLAYVDFSQHQHIVSIGGGYSNHLHALGYKCACSNVRFTALVRGNYQSNLTPMLTDLRAWGCNIHFLSKLEYAGRETQAFDLWREAELGPHLFIPEGGSTQLAVKGVRVMMEEIHQQFSEKATGTPTHFVVPVASGATLAGMAAGAHDTQTAIGIAVLKGQDYLEQQVQRFLDSKINNWRIEHGFVHRGYAKTTDELLAFCEQVNRTTPIAVEPVYSGKAFFALDRLIKQKQFLVSDNIVLVHTGGLQGARANSDVN